MNMIAVVIRYPPGMQVVAHGFGDCVFSYSICTCHHVTTLVIVLFEAKEMGTVVAKGMWRTQCSLYRAAH